MGYLNKEEQTRETIQSDGWLHSGDIGKRDNAGYLYVTGRIKGISLTFNNEVLKLSKQCHDTMNFQQSAKSRRAEEKDLQHYFVSLYCF